MIGAENTPGPWGATFDAVGTRPYTVTRRRCRGPARDHHTRADGQVARFASEAAAAARADALNRGETP